VSAKNNEPEMKRSEETGNNLEKERGGEEGADLHSIACGFWEKNLNTNPFIIWIKEMICV